MNRKPSIVPEWLSESSSIVTLPIVPDSFTEIDADWEEIDTFPDRKFIISAEEVLGDDEETIISSVEKALSDEQAISKYAEQLAETIWKAFTDSDFDKNFHDVYSKKYPGLFKNWIYQAELFSEENLWIIKSKDTTSTQIKNIFIWELQQ